MLRRSMIFTAVISGLLIFSMVQAQEQGARRRRTPGQADQPAARGQDEGARRGGADAAQYRQRMLDGIKEQLGASEDEWKELQPKIEKVLTVQRDTRGWFGGFTGRRQGGEEGAAAGQARSKVAQAQRDLRTALDDKSTPVEDITKKLAALREAREKANAELKAAQKELKGGVKDRQEAVLVLFGLLD
ncbi:MAG: hypothetical protein HY718_01165 [Planctomycetes bacterium]|nr:hypothetical protein [Planctomycetota bacterium]